MSDQDAILERQFQELFQKVQTSRVLRLPDDVLALEPAAHAYFDAHSRDTRADHC